MERKAQHPGVWQKPSQPARCEWSRPPAFIVSWESLGVGNTQHSVPQSDPSLLSLSLCLAPSLPPSLSHFSICVPAAREFEVGRAPKNLQMARSRYRNCAEGESVQSWHGPHEHEMTRALQGLQANLMVLSRRRAHGAIARWWSQMEARSSQMELRRPPMLKTWRPQRRETAIFWVWVLFHMFSREETTATHATLVPQKIHCHKSIQVPLL